MNHLRTLPNKPGYIFVGVFRDGESAQCEVYVDAIGCCSVRTTADSEPCFFQLVGWEPDQAERAGRKDR